MGDNRQIEAMGDRLRAFLALIVVLSAVLGGPAWGQNERRVAWVIGNGAYTNVATLINPPNDAGDIAAVLTSLGFEVTKTIDGDHRAMLQSLADFGRAATGARVALVFYAGHGLQVNGRNYLIPTTARIETEADLLSQGIKVNDILDVMEASGARVKLLFLDACRNNVVRRAFTRATTGGLARIEASTAGTFIAFATAPDRAAADGEGRNSPFTEALLKYIKAPDLEIRALLGRVREQVYEVTAQQQLPWVNEAMIGEFYFGGRTDQPILGRQHDEQVARLQQQLEEMTQRLNKSTDQPASPSLQTESELKDLVLAWGRADLDQELPAEFPASSRTELADHLAAMVALQPFPPPAEVDRTLAQRTLAKLREVPTAHLVYARIKTLAQAHPLPPFRPSEAGGEAATRLFIRKSGRPLDAGIPGLYTKTGFYDFFVTTAWPKIDGYIAELAVLDKQRTKPTEAERLRLLQDIQKLYINDYIEQWDGLVGDLEIHPVVDVAEALEIAELLARKDSPLVKLVQAVALETDLKSSSPAQRGSQTQNAGDSLGALQRHYERLHRLVATDSAAVSPLEQSAKTLGGLRDELRRLNNRPGAKRGTSSATATDRTTLVGLAARLAFEGSNQPEPLGRWLRSFAAGLNHLAGESAP